MIAQRDHIPASFLSHPGKMDDLRDMTADERRHLLDKRRTVDDVRPVTVMVLASVWAGFLLGLLGIFACNLLALLPLKPLAHAAIWVNEHFLWIVGASALISAALMLQSSLRINARTRRQIDADLAAGVVRDISYRITAAKRFREPEHGTYFLFCLTDTGETLVLYDYATGDPDVTRPQLRPQNTIRMIIYPASGEIIYEFSGPPIKPARAKPMNLPPEAWPEAEAICPVPWDRLDAVMTGKAAA